MENAKGHLTKRWSTVSTFEQNTHFGSPVQPFLRRLSFVKMWFCPTNQRNILTFRGIFACYILWNLLLIRNTPNSTEVYMECHVNTPLWYSPCNCLDKGIDNLPDWNTSNTITSWLYTIKNKWEKIVLSAISPIHLSFQNLIEKPFPTFQLVLISTNDLCSKITF